jgi:gamma-glutamylcyclotransferase (GGCT)/AIG2-like uncharacterized protein YtfP
MRESNAEAQDTTRLFIYGTLKRGHGRHDWLRDQRFIGEAVTEPHYRLYNLVAYPALVEVEPGQGRAVQGEVWDVTADRLPVIDRIEDVDAGLYARRVIALQSHPLQTVQAYFFLGGVDDLEDVGDAW